MSLLKDWRFYASIATIIAGVLIWLTIPTRMQSAEKQIVEMQRQDVRQTTILDNTIKNQDRLIKLHER